APTPPSPPRLHPRPPLAAAHGRRVGRAPPLRPGPEPPRPPAQGRAPAHGRHLLDRGRRLAMARIAAPFRQARHRVPPFPPPLGRRALGAPVARPRPPGRARSAARRGTLGLLRLPPRRLPARPPNHNHRPAPRLPLRPARPAPHAARRGFVRTRPPLDVAGPPGRPGARRPRPPARLPARVPPLAHPLRRPPPHPALPATRL
ncbi:MAG: hypothetical protein AVDCRST_MAG04-3317, partial [uncultured Acetobacteraceae bacterium]